MGNGSQFFMCTGETPHLNGKHVVFGKVVQGLQVVMAMERCGSGSGKTSKKVTIRDCGEGTGPANSSAAADKKDKKDKKNKQKKGSKKKKDVKKKKKKHRKKKKKSSSSSDGSDSSSSSSSS